MDVVQASNRCESVLDSISQAVIADREFLEDVILGVLSQGHVLLEDVPGTGKTLTASSFAEALGLSFKRVQFTPDLLPADITGTHIFNERKQRFEFNKGPIFANIVLADEINRAPPKTQAALLEAMGEKQVTVDGETRQLPQPFFVIATQNPVEQEGTFPLPEAQMDRFTIETSLGYPSYEGEVEIISRRASREEQSPSVERVCTTEIVQKLQEVPETVRMNDDIMEYLVQVSRATRDDPRVKTGVSPRGTQRLFEVARARAVLRGRNFVKPNDIKDVAYAVLSHRTVLNADAKVDNVDKHDVIDDILDEIEVPTVMSYEER
ncbi:MAG: MoxR family ATPase [Halobacteriales archaeon]|nr:MoxR family ATPase [Halobacteriales archaeon]